jgi:threonine/homoserine/homoserine lactone efflux protein
MILPPFLKGLLLGFSIAAPVGPIGVLCIRRTLADGRLTGFLSGLGAATADFIYGCIAAFGLTAVSSLLVKGQGALRLVGGVFLIYLGIRIYLSAVAERPAETRLGGGLFAAYASTFFLTLTNPMTILSFAAVFAGLGLVDQGGVISSAAWLVGGVFCGSALWWLLLSGGVSIIRRRFTLQRMRWVNRISGGVISIFGIAAIASLFF